MNIKDIRVNELKEYQHNPRRNDGAVNAVAESIKQFGFKVPIVVDRDNVIVAGHTRLKAAKKLGLKTVPCVIADDLTAEQVKAFRLADNKTAELAEWDLPALEKELDELSKMNLDFNMADFGFLSSDIDVDDIIQDHVPEVDEESEPICKLGDIWELGDHRLICGDSTDKNTVSRLMDGAKADMVFTDPPYGVDYDGINNDDRKGLETLLDSAFKNYKEISKDGASVYLFHSDKCADIFHNIFRKYCHFSSMIIWEKQSLVLSQGDYQSIHEPCMYGWFDNGTHKFYGDRKQTSVWKFDRNIVDGHTTPKPIEFICKALKNSSCKHELVVDLFGGSGSTLIACEQLGRRCYMMELDPKYCDVIIKRWEALTGQKAIKEKAPNMKF